VARKTKVKERKANVKESFIAGREPGRSWYEKTRPGGKTPSFPALVSFPLVRAGNNGCFLVPGPFVFSKKPAVARPGLTRK